MIKIISDEACEFYEKVAEFSFKYLGLSGSCNIELVLTSGEEIRKLNAEFRGIDKETDVLSFPLISFGDGIGRLDKKNYPLEYDSNLRSVSLGSVVINEAMAAAQAEEYGHTLEREKAYLFLHGLLHVFGYDHVNEGDKRTMRTLEEKILQGLNLSVSE